MLDTSTSTAAPGGTVETQLRTSVRLGALERGPASAQSVVDTGDGHS